MKKFQHLITACLFITLIHQSLLPLYAQELTQPTPDVIAPSLTHSPISEKMVLGKPIEISITATDNTGIKDVTLYYRVIGEQRFEQLRMFPSGEQDSYMTVIPTEHIRMPGIEYYVQAEDLAGNKVLRGFDFSPLKIFIVSQELEKAVTVAPPPSAPVSNEPSDNKNSSTLKWILIGLGVAAVAGLGLALGGGGGGGGNGGTTGGSTGTVNIDASLPE